MGNKRKEIRAALKLLLDVEFDNVYTSRTFAISQRENLPAVTIYTPEEPVRPKDLSQKSYIRSLELRIEVRIADRDTADDTLDEMMNEVEQILFDNHSIGGTILSSELTGSSVGVDFDGSEPIGIGTLTYLCLYVG